VRTAIRIKTIKGLIMKNYILTLFTFGIVGCASIAPKVKWIASTQFDRFTDITTCSVSTGSLYTGSSVFTYSNHLYPFIEVVNNDLRVGVKSGGKYKVPVGDVQLRIDSNKAWTISMSETPVIAKPNTPVNAQLDLMTEYAKNLPKEQQKLIVDSYKTAMSTTGKMLSPFTVATGDKAKSILNEMLSGKILIYRTLGLGPMTGNVGGSTGEFLLDASLNTALEKCQIKI
jgi:hypothetical protein